MRRPDGDLIATITLRPTNAGGRRGPTPPGSFKVRRVIEEHSFDARLNLESVGPIAPGDTVTVPVNFLDPDIARRYCFVGQRLILKELRAIGEGVIEKLLP